MGYTKPIYDEVEVNEVPEPQTRSAIVVVVLAGIIAVGSALATGGGATGGAALG